MREWKTAQICRFYEFCLENTKILFIFAARFVYNVIYRFRNSSICVQFNECIKYD